MRVFKVLSVLLDYPEVEVYQHLNDISEEVQNLTGISETERKTLFDFIYWLQSQDIIELQGLYVQTFDLTAEHSLHLTHHLFGDDRGRGPALVDLGEFYKETGWVPDDKELPDYLPLILEFVSTQDEMAAKLFLNDAVKVVTQLATNLEQADSEYAKLLRLIEQRSNLVPTI
ncbi:MAG: nitrate reductase molybdenum cofactor assembly chaperone [Thiohalomonadales bacterium]